LPAPELYPAVDILSGRAVRLVKGEFDRSTEYAADPLDAARRWVEAGARRLHVVDLDGAREGRPVNIGHLARIATELSVPVQYGGGLRDAAAAERALEAGAARVVIGTAAFTDVAVLDRLLETSPRQVAVAVDVRGGRVATGGWTERTDLDPAEAVAALAARGVRAFVFTDTDRDGTLTGVESGPFLRVARAAGDSALVYSGGVGSLADLEELVSIDLGALEGVIVGKALYEGRFTVTEAQAALRPGGAPLREGDEAAR
jgi:phosphoribosylformimino-5-aminoimidazole carboxamide ribotide isomerase